VLARETSRADFCRRFASSDSIFALQDAYDVARLNVWLSGRCRGSVFTS
jgi:hypothetical protein